MKAPSIEKKSLLEALQKQKDNQAEITRTKALETETKKRHADLLASGRFDDPDTVDELGRMQTRAALTNSKLIQLENRDRERQQAIEDEVKRLAPPLASSAVALNKAVEEKVNALLASLIPNPGYRSIATEEVIRHSPLAQRCRAIPGAFGYQASLTPLENAHILIRDAKILEDLWSEFNGLAS